MQKPLALFFKQYKLTSKFITNDITLLGENYTVKVHNTKTTKNWKILSGLFSQFVFLLVNIIKSRFVYIWFADYHSFLPVLFAVIFRKKSVICAGGYECTFIPEVNCGVFTTSSLPKRIRKFCAEFSLKHCSLILPVDETLVQNTNTYIYSDIKDKSPLIDGVKAFIPGIKTPFETIHLGYDSNYFSMPADIIKENAVCGAGLIINEDEFKRKGFDLLIDAARKLKDVKFILAGLNDHYLNTLDMLKLPNLELHGIISYDNLVELYRKSKVFAQISMFEGMPSTICEAMLCECIPIGSNVNGIPEIIGDTGIIINKKSVDDVINAINSVLSSNDFSGKKARERITINFPLHSRQTKLLAAIDSLLNK